MRISSQNGKAESRRVIAQAEWDQCLRRCLGNDAVENCRPQQ
jgi:hypothetical protein